MLAEVQAQNAFLALPSAAPRSQVLVPRHALLAAPERSAGWTSAASAALASAGAAAALALLRRSQRQPRSACRASNNMWERKWWFIKEDQDPTTLPLWQRDFRYGYQVLRRTMMEERKRGRKVFWDVRVLEVKSGGCKVEMLNSGLIGNMPIGHEGMKNGERLKVGEVYKAECLAVPHPRVNKEGKWSPWPKIEPRRVKAVPAFSHFMWLEQQSSIAKAKELKAGDVVKAVVHTKCPKGLVMTMEGPDEPKGMLAMMDISRKMSHHAWAAKMFPKGTEMKCYVVHADQENGRITLSCKEFEDDDHVGWMLSFPERCFKNADKAVSRHDEKRDAYIKWLQR